MSRIKFRVWDKRIGAMGKVTGFIFGSEVRYDLVKYRYANDQGRSVDEQSYYDQNFSNGLDIMQYTGINDEHGNEIYEGDILRWSSDDTDGSIMESLEKVVYRDGCFVLENEYGKITDLLKDGIKYNEEYEKVELVGNIYENAELLRCRENERD